MKKRILQILVGIIVLALLVGAALLIKNAVRDRMSTRYDVEVDISDEQRVAYEQKLSDAQGRIDRKEGEGNDWWLAYLDAARMSSALGRNGDAEGYYRTFLKRFPEHRVGLANYAHLLFETGRYRAAEIIYGRLVSVARIEEDLRDYVEVIKAQNQEGERNADLLSVLEVAVADYGQTAFLMLELADLYQKMGNCELAIQHHEVLLNLVDESQKAQIENDIARMQETCR